MARKRARKRVSMKRGKGKSKTKVSGLEIGVASVVGLAILWAVAQNAITGMGGSAGNLPVTPNPTP
jgi:hypothetical protein